jgi:hypothetical protein
MARASGVSLMSELGRRRGAQESARPRSGTSRLDLMGPTLARGPRPVNWKTQAWRGGPLVRREE